MLDSSIFLTIVIGHSSNSDNSEIAGSSIPGMPRPIHYSQRLYPPKNFSRALHLIYLCLEYLIII